jgi:hypothetical protein
VFLAPLLVFSAPLLVFSPTTEVREIISLMPVLMRDLLID